MRTQLQPILKRKFQTNLLIRKPLWGAVAIFVFGFAFAVLYKPLGAHPGKVWGYALSMAFYAMSASVAAAVSAWGLSRIPYFSDHSHWTLGKEVLAVFISLFALGLGVYLAGFVVEEPYARLNLPTFIDSVSKAFLLGVLPYAFFTVLNLGSYKTLERTNPSEQETPLQEPEQLIHISSQLKKEELSFLPSQFAYAVADGNYVEFYLYQEKGLVKKIIRNSIQNVDEQLAPFPAMVRTHRAYMVNLKMAEVCKGNSLGYRLKLQGVSEEIPVSRNKSKIVLELLKQYL